MNAPPSLRCPLSLASFLFNPSWAGSLNVVKQVLHQGNFVARVKDKFVIAHVSTRPTGGPRPWVTREGSPHPSSTCVTQDPEFQIA
jgi:hypothetical protein